MAIYNFEKHEPQIHESAFIAPSSLVIGNVTIGKNAYIGHGAILRGDYGRIIIGEGTAIEEGVIIHARPDDETNIGKFVTVGHGAMIHNALIEDNAVIGMRATVSDYSRVGQWAIVAEMAMVKNSQQVPELKVVAGVPAAVVSEVNERHKAMWEYAKNLYVEMAARYKAPGAFEKIG